MALFAPSQSPAVIVKEVDLTGGVPNVQTSTGAYVGKFMWGPVEQVTLIGNEEELASTFGTPNSAHSIPYHDAAYFLRYSNALQLTRIIDSSGINAVSTTGQTAAYAVGTYSSPVIKNPAAFDQLTAKKNLRYADHHLDYLEKHLKNPLFIAYAYNGGIGFTKRLLKTNSGRQRLNLHGAINIETMVVTVVESTTVNADSTIELLETLNQQYPLSARLHIILDNARYHYSKVVKKYLKENDRINLVFLSPYSPELNLIERL